MEERSFKCCNSCAFLDCNKDKPSPEGSMLAWYSQDNLDRLWREAKYKGEFLICHSTDGGAKEYGGSDKIKPGRETACTAYTYLLFMHIKIFEVKASYKKYRDAVGHKMALSKRAIGEAAISMMMGRSGLFGGAIIPRSISDERPLVYPTGFEKTVKVFNEIMNIPPPFSNGKAEQN